MLRCCRGGPPKRRERVREGESAQAHSAFVPALSESESGVSSLITMSTLLPTVVRQALAIDVDPAAGRVSG